MLVGLIKKILKTALVLGVCLATQGAFALGMGKLYLYSYLNELLDAEIELIAGENYAATEMIAKLASKQDFIRAGVAYAVPVHIDFRVIKKVGKTFIRATSLSPIREPYLDFVLDLSWGNGRVVRGYKVLLDPAPTNRPVVKRWLSLPDIVAPTRNIVTTKPSEKPRPEPNGLAEKIVQKIEETLSIEKTEKKPEVIKLVPKENIKEAPKHSSDPIQSLEPIEPIEPSKPKPQDIKKLKPEDQFKDLFDEKAVVTPDSNVVINNDTVSNNVSNTDLATTASKNPVVVASKPVVIESVPERQVVVQEIQDKVKKYDLSELASLKSLPSPNSIEAEAKKQFNMLQQLPQGLLLGILIGLVFVLGLLYFIKRLSFKQQGQHAIPLQWEKSSNTAADALASERYTQRASNQDLLIKEAASKLELAQNYVVAQDFKQAKALLEDVARNGDKLQQETARAILEELAAK
ncbi:MAG: FimV/HubP family polar landmark protein [Gammaproteobacteria bacterium]